MSLVERLAYQRVAAGLVIRLGALLLLSFSVVSVSAAQEPHQCEVVMVDPGDRPVAAPEFQSGSAVTIDLLMVYSAAAVTAKRHEWLGSVITEVNRIYGGTGITFRVTGAYSIGDSSRLAEVAAAAEAARPSDADSKFKAFSPFLSHLGDRRVVAVRKSVGADIVVGWLASSNVDSYALTYRSTARWQFSSSLGYNFVQERNDADRAAKTLAHNLGHHLGLGHQPSDPAGNYLDHGVAYEGTHPSLANPYLTVMGILRGRSENFDWLPELSSDSVHTYKGQSIRLGDSNHNAKDAAAVAAPWVASYLPSSSGTPPDLDALPAALTVLPEPPAPSRNPRPVTVDLVVVYSPAAVAARRHERLSSAMTEVNRIFRDTGITFRVMGVYSMRQNSSLARAAARAEAASTRAAITREGVLQALQDRQVTEAREEVGADIVVGWLTSSKLSYSTTFFATEWKYFNPNNAYLTVQDSGDTDWATKALAHHLGHKFGLGHQPSESNGGNYLSFGVAYEGTHASFSKPYRTIMGPSSGAEWISELSSDSTHTHKGQSIFIGDFRHDARRAASITAPWVANYYPPASRVTPPDLGALPTVLTVLPEAPPPPPPPPDDGGYDAEDPDVTTPDPGGPPVVTISAPQVADLVLAAAGEVRSDSAVRYRVSISNRGPGVAGNVVVASTLRGLPSIDAATSGCSGDPDGLPECALGGIEAGESASFTIDVDTGGAVETWLRYTGAASSSASDPTPEDAEAAVSQAVDPPDAPTDLIAVATSSTEVELDWGDNSRIETGFDVLLRGPADAELRRIGSVPANTTSMTVDELTPDAAYAFAVEARNGRLRSERSPEATARTWYSDDSRCGEEDVLCLGRFEVEASWRAPDGRTGRGIAHRLTADSGDFRFFDAASIELVVKVLDGCRINGHYWVFGAGLTDVEVTMTVRDVDNGEELTWTNPQGVRFEPIADRTAVVCGGASGTSAGSRMRLGGALAVVQQAGPASVDRVAQAAEENSCTPGATALCLQDGRYEVRVSWQAGERSGEGKAIPRTSDTGMFWFFDADNVEVVVKVLDGCSFNGRRWVVMAGLTDVQVDVSVRDSRTGAAKLYRNPGGTRFRTMFDITAFPCSDAP